MPWEVMIQRADGQALGDKESVIGAMQAAIPGLEFGFEPSGLEKIAKARAAGIEFPECLRTFFQTQPARTVAAGTLDGCSVNFYGFDEVTLLTVSLEIRGNGDPTASLLALCLQQGWIAIDCASQRPLG